MKKQPKPYKREKGWTPRHSDCMLYDADPLDTSEGICRHPSLDGKRVKGVGIACMVREMKW